MPLSPRQKRKARLRRPSVTGSAKDFAWLVKKTDRINIVTEGDSWFSYPRRWLLAGPNSNIVDWIVSSIRGKDKANFLRLASNGDEAVEIVSGEQKHDLANILKANKGHVHGTQLVWLTFVGIEMRLGESMEGSWHRDVPLK